MRNRLRELLRDREISQATLAERAGMQRSHLSRIANGSEPSLRNARRIAEALGVSIEDVWPSPQPQAATDGEPAAS